MADLEVGLKGYAETMVDESNVASSVGSGLLDVFSTPSMIALMEKACKESVAPFLDEGQGTVGIRLEVDHLAATPIGRRRKKSERGFTNGVSSSTIAFWRR